MDPASIIALASLATEAVKLALAARERARQNAEWTAEQDREFDAKMDAAFGAPHWRVSGKN